MTYRKLHPKLPLCRLKHLPILYKFKCYDSVKYFKFGSEFDSLKWDSLHVLNQMWFKGFEVHTWSMWSTGLAPDSLHPGECVSCKKTKFTEQPAFEIDRDFSTRESF